MKRLAWILTMTLVSGLAAQEPGDSGPGTAPPADGGRAGAAEARQLRERIRQRWTEHVRSTLALNDDQTAKLQATEQRFEERRQPIRARQRAINQALNAELASGTPNQERVKQLINERQENQRNLQQINRGEDGEMQGEGHSQAAGRGKGQFGAAGAYQARHCACQERAAFERQAENIRLLECICTD